MFRQILVKELRANKYFFLFLIFCPGFLCDQPWQIMLIDKMLKGTVTSDPNVFRPKV